MPVLTKVDTSGADELFRRMGWTLKNSLPGFVRQEARLLAVELAKHSQPFGDSDAARIVGVAAVTKQIYQVYATPGKVWEDIADPGAADGFWKAVKTSAWDRVRKIIDRSSTSFKSTPIDNFDGGAAHRQLRNNQGRIAKSQKPVVIVRNPSALKNYVQSEQKKVGFGKGGWSSCAKVLGGTRGIPGFVSRQKSPGRVVEDYGTDISKVTMINQVPYAHEIIDSGKIADSKAIARDRLLASVRKAARESRTR